MGKGLSDFSRWYCRHTGQWKWRERKPDKNADALGHVTEGAGPSKGYVTAEVRVELQRRETLTLPKEDAEPAPPQEVAP